MKTVLAILGLLAVVVVTRFFLVSSHPCENEDAIQYLDTLWEYYQPITEADRGTEGLWESNLSNETRIERLADAHATIVVYAREIKALRPPEVYEIAHREYEQYADAMIDMTEAERYALASFQSDRPLRSAPFFERAFAFREVARSHLVRGETAVANACE